MKGYYFERKIQEKNCIYDNDYDVLMTMMTQGKRMDGWLKECTFTFTFIFIIISSFFFINCIRFLLHFF